MVEGGQKFAEGGDPFGVGPQGLQAATAIKHTDKIIEKNNLKPEGKIEIKDHKNENKELRSAASRQPRPSARRYSGLIMHPGSAFCRGCGSRCEKIENKIENKDKVELKDHKSEIKELKGEKDFKIEQKEHGKPEFDKFIDQKQVFEGGPKLADAGNPFQQPGGGGLQAASGPAAAIKPTDKLSDKTFGKQEGKDKLEFKDQKNEPKEFKIEQKDHKNEFKDHKNEFKEHVKEKFELKEHAKTEFEKTIRENVKDVVENVPKFAEGGDPFQVNQGVLGLQAATAPVNALKIKENIKSEIEKIKREKEIEKIKPEKEHIKEIEKIKPEKEFAKDFTKDFLIDKGKVEFEKLFPENPKQLVEGGPKLAEGGDPVRPGTPAPGLQGASEPAGGGASTQAAASPAAGAAAAKFPKLEFEKHDKFPKIEFEKHPKLEIEKIKFEGEKVKFEGEKIKFEKEKEFIFDKPKPEFEKILQEGPKVIAEGPGPVIPNLPDPASRIAQLEAAVAQLSTFITQGMRPDLGAGALTNEPDQKPAQPAEGKPAPKAEQKPESKSKSKSDPKGKRG